MAPSNYIPLDIPISSFILGAWCSEAEQRLAVQFKGGQGYYANVGKVEFDMIQTECNDVAGSFGKLLHKVFRADDIKYPYKALDSGEFRSEIGQSEPDVVAA